MLVVGRQAETKPLELAPAKIEEAQRMASLLKQMRTRRRRDASTAINDVFGTTVKRLTLGWSYSVTKES